MRRKIAEKMAEINSDFRKDVTKRLAGVTTRRELPEIGLNPEQVLEEVRDHVALGMFLLFFFLFRVPYPLGKNGTLLLRLRCLSVWVSPGCIS